MVLCYGVVNTRMPSFFARQAQTPWILGTDPGDSLQHLLIIKRLVATVKVDGYVCIHYGLSEQQLAILVQIHSAMQ